MMKLLFFISFNIVNTLTNFQNLFQNLFQNYENYIFIYQHPRKLLQQPVEFTFYKITNECIIANEFTLSFKITYDKKNSKYYNIKSIRVKKNIFEKNYINEYEFTYDSLEDKLIFTPYVNQRISTLNKGFSLVGYTEINYKKDYENKLMNPEFIKKLICEDFFVLSNKNKLEKLEKLYEKYK